MKILVIFLFIVLHELLYISTVNCEPSYFLNERFANLDNWQNFYFKKINKHSNYSLEKIDDKTVLKTISDSSSSAILLKKEFNPNTFNKIKWSWKINNIYKKGNGLDKRYDDYPIRIYVLFKFNEDKASLIDLTIYKALKLIYGYYPPLNTLVYAYGNNEIKSEYKSPYTKKAHIILVDKGEKNLKKWIEFERDLLKDYKTAFGKEPPDIATIGIMSDSDNTGEKSEAFINFIEVYKNE